MLLARQTRLALREVRLAAEKMHKALKADFLAACQEIDAAKKELSDIIEPLETRLKAQEEFAEREMAKRMAELRTRRVQALVALGVAPDNLRMQNIEVLTEEQFTDMLEDAQMARNFALAAEQARQEAEAKRLEEERQERARLKVENERLQAEAAAAKAERERIEAEQRKEREANEQRMAFERQQAQARIDDAKEAQARRVREVEALRKAEQQKREAAERELQVAREKEAAAKRAADEARLKAERAPDREKLEQFASTIRSLVAPNLSDKWTRSTRDNIHRKLSELADFIMEESKA
jgi:colicin import membrane protein